MEGKLWKQVLRLGLTALAQNDGAVYLYYLLARIIAAAFILMI